MALEFFEVDPNTGIEERVSEASVDAAQKIVKIAKAYERGIFSALEVVCETQKALVDRTNKLRKI